MNSSDQNELALLGVVLTAATLHLNGAVIVLAFVLGRLTRPQTPDHPNS